MTAHTERVPVRRSATRAWVIEVLLVAGVLGALVVFAAPTLRQPLVERHGFRQTQTAFQARVFREEGIDLLHPKVPVLGEPFEIPFEFPLLQAGASIMMGLGLEEDLTMRLSGLVCFLATAVFLYGLVRQVAGSVAAFGALVAFAFTPFALLWSRTSMIEYLATAGAVGFTWAFVSRRESGRPLPGALALVAGTIGMLVKPTTAIFWILPALLYRPVGPGSASGRRRLVDPRTVVIVGLPIVAALLWTRHADAVKAASQTTMWLTSEELRSWNFGTLAQRFDPEVWRLISDRVWLYVLGLLAVFLPLAAVAVARSRQWPFWLGITSAAFLPPLVFTNLYAVHDYYLAAITPALAALVGLGVGYGWKTLPRQPAVALVAISVGVLAVLGSLYFGRGYAMIAYEDQSESGDLALAREIETLTRPDENVAVVGLDWSPAVLYYAHRRGHMVPPANEEIAYDLIDEQNYRHLLVANPAETDLGFLSRWGWVGALGPHTYGIANSPEELLRESFVATDDDGVAGTRGKLLATGLHVPCEQTVRIPSGTGGTWLHLEDAPEGALVSISHELAPLPARARMFVGPELATGRRLALSCTGTSSLAIAEVEDGGPPR